MKKLKNALPIVLIAVITVVIFIFVNNIRKGSSSNNGISNDNVELEQTVSPGFTFKENLTSETNVANINLQIKFDDKDYTYDLEVQEGAILFDVLTQLADVSNDFSFEYDQYDFGVLVTSVNGFTPDPNLSFWKIVVNGEDAQVGVSDLVVSNGDQIILKTEVIQF